MPWSPGQRLGPYEIVAPLGAGGMGEVYEAKDTRLGRTVAIKVLPEDLAHSPERRARLEREARTISQLSHPHVCTLHDVGEEDGTLFLVMERLEGETLAERLQRGPLPLEPALRFGAQIAEALDAAHRRGVVHRDLKPSNVMLTASGVKLLDFGLARVAAGDARMAEGLPTATEDGGGALTRDGIVVGTFPYMSPEQIEGSQVDARSDIFALGAVLYEMVTGSRAFGGDSGARVMAAVLREHPRPLSKVEPMSPRALDHLVSGCLAKDPEQRWQNARDVALGLRRIAEAGARADGEAPPAAPRGNREPLAWAIAAVAVAALVGVYLWAGRPSPEIGAIPSTISLSFQLPPGYVLLESAFTQSPVEVAPDGSFVVFGARAPDGKSGIFRRSADSLELEFVAGTEGGRQPFVSPDSRWIGFYTDEGGLAKVRAEGGLRQPVYDVERLLPLGACWGSRDRIFFPRGLTGGIAVVSSSGGEIETLTVPDPEAGEIGHWYPKLLPGGENLLFGAWTVDGWKSLVLDLGSGALRVLDTGNRKGHRDPTAPATRFGGHPNYVDSGHLVWLEGEDLVAAPFDVETLKFLGHPVTVLSGVNSFHLTRRGILTYVTTSSIRASGIPTRWSARDHEPATIEGAGRARQLRVSPDGSRLAIAATPHVWVFELDRGVRSQLTVNGVINNFPVWSADGHRLVFNSLRAPHGLYVRAADGVGDARLVFRRTNEVIFLPASWTPDGRSVAVTELHPDGQTDVGLVHLESGATEPLVTTKAREHSPAFSPGGHWLAYVSDLSGRDEVYVRPYPEEGPRVTISASGGTDPRWSSDGRHLLFRNGPRIYQVAVEPGPEELRVQPDSLRQLAELPGFVEPYVPYGPTWDLAPNGDLIYLRDPAKPTRAAEIFIIYGWSRTLPSA